MLTISAGGRYGRDRSQIVRSMNQSGSSFRSRNQSNSSVPHSPTEGSAKSNPTPCGTLSKMWSSAGTPASGQVYVTPSWNHDHRRGRRMIRGRRI